MVTLDQAGWIGSDARLRPPAAPLADLVEHSFVLDLGRASHRSWKVLPDYCAHVIVHVSDGEHGVRASLVGPRSSAIDVDVSRRRWTAGVRLTPGALPILTGIPASALLDTSVPLEGVWGSAGARLAERLSGTRSPTRLVALVMAFLVDRVSDRRERDWRARGLVHHVRGAEPDVRIADVAARLGVSERGLRARSLEMIGLSPKRVARTHRLFRAVDQAAGIDAPDWSSIATRVGYADQPHMIREFRALLGETPSTFHDRGRASRPRADSFKTGRAPAG